MKQRQGFVSNSSTTSFCIYGINLNSFDKISLVNAIKKTGLANLISKIDEMLKNEHYWAKRNKAQLEMLKRIEELDENEMEIVEHFLQCNSERFLKLCLGDSFSINYGPDGDLYIGRNWSEIRDNETGAQFKENVEESLRSFLEVDLKCSTYEEAWRDG